MTNPETQHTIEIPQLDGESTRAFDARVRYISAGPQRDIRSVAQELGKSGSLISRWSSKFEWVKHAREYDRAVAYITVEEAAREYRESLKEYRERYQKTGKDLYAVATALLYQCNQAIRGRRIVDRDGVEHFIPAMEMTPATLNTAVRGILAAADLEAASLQLEEVLPKLTTSEQILE